MHANLAPKEHIYDSIMAGFIGFFFTCNKHSPHLLALSVVPPPSQLDIGQLLQLATIQTEALVSGCTLHNIHKRKNCSV